MRHDAPCMIGLILATLLIPGTVMAQTAAPAESLDQTVGYLLDVVARSDCTFIRNDEPHTGKEAAEHMKAKYDHFKKQIKTPEDFIRLAATKSLMTGKSYLVKRKDGTEIECGEWLGKVLDDHRKPRSESNVSQ